MLKKYFNDEGLTKQINSMTIVDEYRLQPTLKLVEMIRQALSIPNILIPTGVLIAFRFKENNDIRISWSIYNNEMKKVLYWDTNHGTKEQYSFEKIICNEIFKKVSSFKLRS